MSYCKNWLENEKNHGINRPYVNVDSSPTESFCPNCGTKMKRSINRWVCTNQFCEK